MRTSWPWAFGDIVTQNDKPIQTMLSQSRTKRTKPTNTFLVQFVAVTTLLLKAYRYCHLSCCMANTKWTPLCTLFRGDQTSAIRDSVVPSFVLRIRLPKLLGSFSTETPSSELTSTSQNDVIPFAALFLYNKFVDAINYYFCHTEVKGVRPRCTNSCGWLVRKYSIDDKCVNVCRDGYVSSWSPVVDGFYVITEDSLICTTRRE